MQALWGERRRIGLWRRLWLALMQGEKDLGLAIPDSALAQLRASRRRRSREGSRVRAPPPS
jgi:adenylosuccinate lyase